MIINAKTSQYRKYQSNQYMTWEQADTKEFAEGARDEQNTDDGLCEITFNISTDSEIGQCIWKIIGRLCILAKGKTWLLWMLPFTS